MTGKICIANVTLVVSVVTFLCAGMAVFPPPSSLQGTIVAIDNGEQITEVPLPDSQRAIVAQEFKVGLESGLVIVCRDRDEWRRMLDHMKELRKAELNYER